MPRPTEIGKKCHIKCLQKIDNIIAANRHLRIGFGDGCYSLNSKVAIPSQAKLETAKRGSLIYQSAGLEKPKVYEHIKTVPKRKPQPRRVAEKKAATAAANRQADKPINRTVNQITQYLTKAPEGVEVEKISETKVQSRTSKSSAKNEAKPGTVGSKQALSAPRRSNKRSNGLGDVGTPTLNSPSELIVTNDMVDDTLVMFMEEYGARAKLDEDMKDPMSVCRKFSLELANLHLDPINSDTPPHEEDCEELSNWKVAAEASIIEPVSTNS